MRRDSKPMNKTDHDVIEKEIKPSVKQSDWESPKVGEEHYSTNQIIAAYQAGIAKGVSSAQKLLQEKFVENLEKTAKDTGKLISQLSKFNIKLSRALLKVIAWDQFEVLIILPEKEYLGEKFEKAYIFVGGLEDEVQKDHYSITFCFCPESQYLNMEKVKSDGFTLQHRALQK